LRQRHHGAGVFALNPNEAGLPFLLVFDVAADDVGDIGVLFFLLHAIPRVTNP
jgi:hypothetical protein